MRNLFDLGQFLVAASSYVGCPERAPPRKIDTRGSRRFVERLKQALLREALGPGAATCSLFEEKFFVVFTAI